MHSMVIYSRPGMSNLLIYQGPIAKLNIQLRRKATRIPIFHIIVLRKEINH